MTSTFKPFREAKILIALATPIIITQLLQISTMVVDTLMAGRANATELSGVAVGSSLWVPLFLMMIGTLGALTPTVAQSLGARDFDDIPFQVSQSFWKLVLLLPVGFSVALVIKPVFVMMDVSDTITPIATGYFHALLWGLPAVLGYNIIRYYSDGLGLTRPAMYASLVGALANIPLNYVLIFGKLGFPALGGVGCGWASAVSFWIMFLFMAVWVLVRREYSHVRIFTTFHRPHLPAIIKLYQIGLPIGTSYLVESSVFSVIALFLSRFGTVVVAAHQIALNVASVVFMIPLSLGITLTIRVGQLIGANQAQQAQNVAFLGVFMSLAYGACTAILLWVFNMHIPAMYNNQQEVINLAAQLLIFAAIFQLGDATQVAAAGALRGYKDTKVPMFIVVLAFWMMGLPVGYSLGIVGVWGEPMLAKGFWIGLIVALMVVALFLVARLRRVSRRAIPVKMAASG